MLIGRDFCVSKLKIEFASFFTAKWKMSSKKIDYLFPFLTRLATNVHVYFLKNNFQQFFHRASNR